MSASHHGLRPAADVNVLDRWREQAEQDERERVRVRLRRQHEQRRQVAESAATEECKALRAELEALRAERQADLMAVCEVIAEELNNRVNRLIDDIKEPTSACARIWRNHVERRFDTLEARVGAIDPQAKRGEFKFARERDVEELPAFLPARRVIN
jgi:hypothetical protein